MSRTLYEALFGEAGADGLVSSEPLASLARLARQRRDADDMAEGEFRDGIWVREASAVETARRLAASSAPALEFPAWYRGEGWTVVLSLSPDGQPYAALEAGPSVWMEIEGARSWLEAGVDRPLPGLIEPPAHLVLIDEGGQRWEIFADER